MDTLKGYDDWLASPYTSATELEPCDTCDCQGKVCEWCSEPTPHCSCPVVPPGEERRGPLTQGDLLTYAKEYAGRMIDCSECEGAWKP